MARVLRNHDVASLYPNLVKLYGYSSRNQRDKKAYTDLLEMRIKAKHGKLTEDFLAPLGLTNGDLKIGLKLPLNAYTGTLRATFNPLYDNLQGFSICSTGQMFIMQLIHDLKQIPTVEMVSANTDAVMYSIEEEYIPQADKVLKDWQELTGLELEDDDIQKIIMRDVNNYVEILKVGDNDYDIHYKGGEFRGNHKFKWDKEEKKFHYEFKDALENNSLTIVSEAMLKYLLFDIPVEDTINKCDDVFRFQKITHLGSTYDRMIIEYPNGDQEILQRNNRIYAGVEKNGAKIYKIKDSEGRKDSLADCPLNPIVDNANEITIEKINKLWYIKYAKQKISDFIGKGEVYMEEKLDKLKKDELINKVKELQEKLEGSEDMNCEIEVPDAIKAKGMLFQKIQNFRRLIRERDFVLDKELPNNLGGGEYVSVEQYYQAVQDASIEAGLDFSFEVINVDEFNLAAFKPATGAPQHIATVRCRITFTDIETGMYKEYIELSQGSDILDKSVNGASTFAFRNWFDKNFTPRKFNGEIVDFGADNNNVTLDNINIPSEQKTEVKTKVYVSPEKKEEIKKEITEQPQKTDSKDDIEKLTSLIMKYRELSGDETKGAKTIQAIIDGTITDAEVLSKTLSFENAIEKLGA